jgi:hypothetical protein
VWVVGVLWGGGGDAGFGVVSRKLMPLDGGGGGVGKGAGLVVVLFLLSITGSSLNWKHEG